MLKGPKEHATYMGKKCNKEKLYTLVNCTKIITFHVNSVDFSSTTWTNWKCTVPKHLKKNIDATCVERMLKFLICHLI